MIGIFSKAMDEVFLEKFNMPYEMLDVGSDAEKMDGLFLDWVPPSLEKDFLYQAQLIEKHVRKIPIDIFDRHFSLTHKEVSWMRKHRVFLFEPAIMTNRSEFIYLPEWCSYYSVLDTDERSYDVIDISQNLEFKIEGFEKWYKEYARLFPDKKVAYYTKNIVDFKREEYKKNGLIFIEGKVLPDYTCSNFTVINGSRNIYEVGYFNPVYFIAMNQGCVPLLPDEHRFFHVLFKNLIMKDLKEMDYYVSLYGKVRGPIIEEIFERMKKYFPEFTVEYATDIIRKCYE